MGWHPKNAMDPPKKDAWIKGSHQELLIAGLNQFRGKIFGFAERYLEERDYRLRVSPLAPENPCPRELRLGGRVIKLALPQCKV